MRQLRILILFIFAFTLSFSAQAKLENTQKHAMAALELSRGKLKEAKLEKGLDRLMELELYPTISEIMSMLGESAFDENADFPPVYEQAMDNVRFHPDMESIAVAIARAELITPGATYAFLGRDSTPVANIFEAFFLAIGQTDRVGRIH